MLPICGFLAIAQAAQGVPAEVVPVQNMRPSKMVEILNQIQPSTVLSSDDEKGVLYIRAGKETVEQYKAFTNLFDVKPRRVKIRVEADSQIDRSNSTMETVISNNRKFAFSDEGTGLEVQVAPRINDDNTITMYVSPTYAKKTTSVVFRVKQNEGVSLCLAPDGSVSFLIDSAEKHPTGDVKVLSGNGIAVLKMEEAPQAVGVRKWPTLRFKVAIEDEAAPKAK